MPLFSLINVEGISSNKVCKEFEDYCGLPENIDWKSLVKKSIMDKQTQT